MGVIAAPIPSSTSSSPTIIPSSSPASSSNVGTVTAAIMMIMAGCVANVFTLEVITKRDSGAGSLLTLSQFVFIAIEGFIQHWQWRSCSLAPRKIPLKLYARLVVMFFVLSVINNLAIGYGISIPVHTVFRSCSLAASLLVGLFFYQRTYSRRQIYACILVTIGITITTLADAMLPKECCEPNATAASSSSSHAFTSNTSFSDWLIGVTMLLAALIMSAILGHMQDQAYLQYGRAWQENLFYSHLLALPGFIFVGNDIITHATKWITMQGIPIGCVFGTATTINTWLSSLNVLPSLWHINAPSLLQWIVGAFVIGGANTSAATDAFDFDQVYISMWVVLAANLVLQWICIRGVFILTSATSTLTCTLTITMRKFVSLVISILYFNNPFTNTHWAGTLLVFAGIFLYIDTKPKAKAA